MEHKMAKEPILSAMPEKLQETREEPKKKTLAVVELEKRLAPSGGGQVGWGC